MVLTSHRPPFQIDQSGVVSHLGVFPDGQGDNLGYMQYFEINLSRPRPDRPPLFYHKQNYDVAATQTPKAFTTYYRWASDSKITVTFGKYYSDARPPGFGNHNLSWWLPYTDFRYTPGGGGGGTNRICIDPQKYLQISKRNIDVLTANDSGLLFHPSKSFMHVANRFEVGTDTDINVPNNSSGIPFVYFAMIRPFATWDNIICTMGFAGDKPWSGFNPVGSAFTALNRYAYMSTATNLKQRYIVPNGLVSLWFNAIYFTKN